MPTCLTLFSDQPMSDLPPSIVFLHFGQQTTRATSAVCVCIMAGCVVRLLVCVLGIASPRHQPTAGCLHDVHHRHLAAHQLHSVAVFEIENARDDHVHMPVHAACDGCDQRDNLIRRRVAQRTLHDCLH